MNEPEAEDVRDESPTVFEAADQSAAESHDETAELRDRVLRLQAELENFRKRARREFDEAQRYREIDLLRDLLPVLDNLLRAVDAAEKTADADSLRAGFRMTAQQIEKLLGSHGCTTI